MLQLRVLGELELIRGGVPLPLPPSRKTKALLAFLAISSRPHRRERLCEIFWDVPEDPRGALRWALSKLRGLVDDPGCPRLCADRQMISLRKEGLSVDLLMAQATLTGGAVATSTSELQAAAELFRGEFLAGLDLHACSEFQSWFLALREDARQLHLRILRLLADRLKAEPAQALPYARELVGLDMFDEQAWVLLIQTLAAAGRTREAEEQYETAVRALREIGVSPRALLRAEVLLRRPPEQPRLSLAVAAGQNSARAAANGFRKRKPTPA